MQMYRNLVGIAYGRFCIKFPQSKMKGERHMGWASSLMEVFMLPAELKLS